VTRLDWFLSLVGLSGFVFFLSIIVSFAPEPALIAVIAAAVGLALYDFWIRPFVKRR